MCITTNRSDCFPEASSDILQRLDMLRQRTQETRESFGRMEKDQKTFMLKYNAITNIKANLMNLHNQTPSQKKY